MRKNLIFEAFSRSGQKWHGHNHVRAPKKVSLITQLMFQLVVVLGVGLASLVGLLGPIHFFPGTAAAQAASNTLDVLDKQAVKPALSGTGVVINSVSSTVSSLINFNLGAQNTLAAIKITPPQIFVAEDKPTNVTHITTELIAETIQDTVDPMLNEPNNLLFPEEISLTSTDNIGGRESTDTAVVTEEKKEVTPSPIPAPKPQVTPRPVAKPTQAPVVAKVPGLQGYLWPIKGGISTNFSRYHPGIDIMAKFGTPVVSTGSGVVTGVITHTYGLGKHVIIEHPNGLKTVYAHLNGFNVSLGQSVGAGSVIGYVGLTGRTTGPHLHFEAYQNGVAINPLGRLF